MREPGNAGGSRRRGRPDRRPPRLVALLLVLGGAFVGLILVESLARLASPARSYAVPRVASELELARRRGGQRSDGGPSSYDAEGFRAEGGPREPDRTVLFLGDSFTQGYGVRDGASFVAATSRALETRGQRVRCLNGGISGVGTAQELRLLRSVADGRPLDAVVLQLFPYNDLHDNWEDGGFGVVNGRLVEHVPARPPDHVAWRSALGDRSPRSAAVRLVLDALLRPTHRPTDRDFALERLLLERAREVSRARRVPLLLAVVGKDSECASVRARGAGAAPTFARVLTIARGLGVPTVDLCAVVHEPSLFRDDGHYTVEGNTRVGAAIAARLDPLLRRPDRTPERIE